jgi:hypothetical protein
MALNAPNAKRFRIAKYFQIMPVVTPNKEGTARQRCSAAELFVRQTAVGRQPDA